MNVANDATREVADLLQHLIRNACVNDGTPESGGESRSVDTLAQYLGAGGMDVETFEPINGRASLVARIEGRRPEAPSLLLMGHTDVVPVTPERWKHDPFGGELVDGEVWGRGAVDMLNLTASMAVAVRHLAASGFRPDGTLIYLAVADEEALGTFGAAHLIEHERDAVIADNVITESGGIPLSSPSGVKLPVLVAEKGTWWCTLRIRGTPGHASQPYGTDNALVKAAEVVGRLAGLLPPAVIHDTWRRFVSAMGFPEELSGLLVDPAGIEDACKMLPLAIARQFHACTHTTIAPTVVRGGVKTNVIPDNVELELDVRTLPGQRGPDVKRLLDDALGDLRDEVEVVQAHDDPSTESAVTTALWDCLDRTTKRFYADSSVVPMLSGGATDARFFRRAGSTAYGFGLFSRRITFEQYGAMFHGDDERVDLESLRLSTELWGAVARDLLAG